MDMGQQWNHLKYTNHYRQWIVFLEELKQLQGPIETVVIPPEKAYLNESTIQSYSSSFATSTNMAITSSFIPMPSNTDSITMTSTNFGSYNSYNNNPSKSASEKKSSPFQIAVKIVGVDVRMKTISRADNSCIVLSSETITCDGFIQDDCDVSEIG